MKSKDRWSTANALLLPAGLEVCPGWCRAPLCCSHPWISQVQHFCQAPTGRKKGHVQFLMDFIRNTNIKPRSIQRKKKSLGPQQKQCSLLCKQIKQKDLQSKTFIEETKKKIILALGNSCMSEPQLLPSRAHNQSALATSLLPRSQMLAVATYPSTSQPQGAAAVQRSWTQSYKGSAPEKKPVQCFFIPRYLGVSVIHLCVVWQGYKCLLFQPL